MKACHLFLAGFIMLAAAPALAEGDVEHGKEVFKQCSICHAVEPGQTKLGPSLAGVVGRHAASLPGYTYSSAMKKYDVTWEPDTLDHYLTAPMKTVPGTKMAFAGLQNEKDRQDVIAYLQTLK